MPCVRESPSRLDGYTQKPLAALRAAAPDGVGDPRVVVLTPGPGNAAYFEHALPARLMALQLVEGHDPVRCGNRARTRTTRVEMPVHVVHRRLDDDFPDPLRFRPDSVIGGPGTPSAAQAGAVIPSNAFGNGIADDKPLYTYVPGLIRYCLGEEAGPAGRGVLPAGRAGAVGGRARAGRPAGHQAGGRGRRPTRRRPEPRLDRRAGGRRR